MEARLRKPFQGVANIIRFNWHYYAIAGALVIVLSTTALSLESPYKWLLSLIIWLALLSTTISLLVSFYVYDRSPLYEFKWMKEIHVLKNASIANIHAGFDETSSILSRYFPDANLRVFDFYNPARHTEVSIERARKAYEAYPGTVQVSSMNISLENNSVDLLFNIFALHEIRDRSERVGFLKSENSKLKNDGRCIVVEHLRDLSNFLAFNIGFLHFLSAREWKDNFVRAGFVFDRVIKVTPFVTVFILQKRNGYTP